MLSFVTRKLPNFLFQNTSETYVKRRFDTVKYKYSNSGIAQDRRQEINEKILYLIDNDKTEEFNISGEEIFNGYTGVGGLHNLSRNNYNDYSSYSKAKKEIENGQFFTPFSICELIAKCINPAKDALVADLTCGMGRFFNFLPTESNLYGCELDNKAYKVAKHLFPTANIK